MKWISTGVGAGAVEVAMTDNSVLVRKADDLDGPVQTFTPEEWQAFLSGVRDHEFDM